jgi:hypothetical protein
MGVHRNFSRKGQIFLFVLKSKKYLETTKYLQQQKKSGRGEGKGGNHPGCPPLFGDGHD